jgi:hypothetical protein
MSEQSPGVPVTWPELRSSGIGERWLDPLRRLPEELSDDIADPPKDLGLQAMQCASVVTLLGGEVLRPTIDMIRPKLEYARRALEVNLGGRSPTVRLGLLSALNALECGGLLAAPFGGLDAGGMLDRLAGEAGDLPEPERHTGGLAAVAAGKTKLVSKFVGGGKLPAKIQPGETFAFNVPGFVRYMAVAADKGVSAAAVEPAWLDFVSAFPRKLAAETLSWPDLLWAGRIYYHLFEKRPTSEVGKAVRELVSSR